MRIGRDDDLLGWVGLGSPTHPSTVHGRMLLPTRQFLWGYMDALGGPCVTGGRVCGPTDFRLPYTLQ